MSAMRLYSRSLLRFLLCCIAFGPAAAASIRQPPPGKKELPTRLVALCLVEKDGKLVTALLSIDPVSSECKVLANEASNARVSPDGSIVVFNRDSAVWNADTGGSNNPGKVFDHKADPYGGPVWARDGKHLYLSSITSSPGSPFWTHVTWQYDANGRNPVQVKLPAGEAVLDESPDGKYFLTRSRPIPALNASVLLLYDHQGKVVRQLSEPGKFNEPGRFSPDGKRVAYCRGNDVLVVPVGSTGGENVFGQAGVHVEDCCWSPDGKSVAVLACDYGAGGLIAASAEASWRIEIVEVAGKTSSKLSVNWGGKLLRLFASVDWHTVSE